MKEIFKIVCAAALALGAMASAATAQSAMKVGDAIGDWIFNCRALSASDTVCGLNQRIAATKSKRPIMSLTLRKVGPEKKLALIVNVPLGVYLATGIGAKLDEGEQFNQIWQTCTQQGCQAALSLDEAKTKAMKSGEKLLVGFKGRPDAKAVTIAASLKGVTAGLKALGVD